MAIDANSHTAWRPSTIRIACGILDMLTESTEERRDRATTLSRSPGPTAPAVETRYSLILQLSAPDRIRMATMRPQSDRLSKPVRFDEVEWASIPDAPGTYVIYDKNEVIYVGMAGRDRNGSLRNRLRDHASGQIVNMFAQYLFLSRVQFVSEERIRHPNEAKKACRAYLRDNCAFRFVTAADGAEARQLEQLLKRELQPVLNP